MAAQLADSSLHGKRRPGRRQVHWAEIRLTGPAPFRNQRISLTPSEVSKALYHSRPAALLKCSGFSLLHISLVFHYS